MVVVIVVTVVAAVLRLYRLRSGYAHGVVDYDSGVYFGSSLDLMHGRLPYRDFVLVHPPGITLLMTPLAWLSSLIGTASAMGLAKVMTALAGAASVPLVARLVWHRGVLVAVLAAAIAAVQVDAVTAGFGLLLEPWVVLFCLLGAVLTFHADEPAQGRRLLWGGIAFGFACAVKIWAFAPMLAVLLVLMPDRRRAARHLAGVAIGFLVPVLPFAVLAPGAFVHDVFTVQLFRSTDQRTASVFRLIHLFSVGPPTTHLPDAARGWLITAGLVIAGSVVVLWVCLARRAAPLERFAVLAAVAVVGMLFVPGTFYWHYAAFAAPFLALAAALPVARLPKGPAVIWALVLVACVGAQTATLLHRNQRGDRLPDDYRQVTSVIPAGACVVTSMSSAMIADDRFVSDDPDCPTILDPFGTALAYGNGRSPSKVAPRTPALVRIWAQAYRRADYLYFVTRGTRSVPVDVVLDRYLADHFHRVDVAGLRGTLYARN
ncbi:MAG: glycosyltransferase family 87 protein [Jatrophihabitans sp.]